MKSSKRLRMDIINHINKEFDIVGDLISQKFRKDVIDHDTWKELYSTLIRCRTDATTHALERIDFYCGKR